MPGFYGNNVTQVVPSGTAGAQYSAVTGYERAPFDTEMGGGASPATVAPSTFQIAALFAAMAANAVTEASNAATLNTLAGTITSAAQTTAAGSTYTVTLTNSNVTATSKVQASVYSKSNTTTGLSIQSITPAAGSVVIVVANGGSAALNGTIVIPFAVSGS